IVSRDEVVSILQTADALILPLRGTGTIEMGISSKLYEYQAAEKPIICCSTGQSGKYVRETDSGLVVQPGNSAELSEAILFLVENPEVADQYGKNGRRYVELHMRIESIGEELKNFFHRTLSI
ncbi:MAG: glycosyltransferase, partial [Candidatus Sifarchaeia archaeon]